MKKFKVGNIVETEGRLFLIVHERDDCVPHLFTARLLGENYKIIFSEDETDFFELIC